MPCIVKVRIVSARHLPKNDHPLAVQISFGPFPLRTSHFSESHTWNEDFRYEVSDDALLQDHHLQFRLIEHFGAMPMGVVRIDLNPLLAVDSPYSLSGWFPLLDSQGVKGELSLQCRLQFFGDSNPFKDSSAGIQFYSYDGIPSKYAALIGLVDFDISVPIDPPASSSHHQLYHKYSELNQMLYEQGGQVKRQIGRKVLEMGGNAVLAYKQHVDICHNMATFRAIGTAAKLYMADDEEDLMASSNADDGHMELQSPTGTIDLMTISVLPPQSCLSIGGVVSAKAVKLLCDFSVDEQVEIKSKWQSQLREEMRTHARTLNCTVVLGYEELVVIEGDLCILMAFGTAGRIDLRSLLPHPCSSNESDDRSHDNDDAECPQKKRYRDCLPCHIPYKRHQAPFETVFSLCKLCKRRYVPQVLLSTIDPPKGLELLGSDHGPISLIEAFVVKSLHNSDICTRGKRNEMRKMAGAVSVVLPFVEYDIHRQLIYKLRILGCNSIFGLKYRMTVTSTHVIAMAQGTAVFLAALPQPPLLKVSRTLDVMDEEDGRLMELQRAIVKQSQENHELFEELVRRLRDSDAFDSSLSSATSTSSSSDSSSTSSTEDEDELNDAMAVVQIDDDADEEVMAVLVDPKVSCEFIRHGTIDIFNDVPHARNNEQCESSPLLYEFTSLFIDPLHPNTSLSLPVNHSISQMAESKCPECRLHRLDSHFISGDHSVELFSLASVHCPDRLFSRAVIIVNSGQISNHKIVSNYGQVTIHCCCLMSDRHSSLAIIWTEQVMPMLKAYIKAFGGNAMTSLKLVCSHSNSTGMILSVAGDVVEVLESKSATFSSPDRLLMIGRDIL